MNDTVRDVKSGTGPAPGSVGRSIPRVEGSAKVTGRAQYVYNMVLPGMLHGKICRSTVAHGRIKRIDVSAARALRLLADASDLQ